MDRRAEIFKENNVAQNALSLVETGVSEFRVRCSDLLLNAGMKLRLGARVSSDSPDAVGRLLVGKFGATSVAGDGSDWFVRAPGHRGLVPVVLR
jgi:hypothetical protein